MEISPYCLLSLLPIFLLSGFSLSHDEFDPHGATSRALLQAKTTCKEDFASKNYTIITSRCKGPNYPAKVCCSAFKDFACPFAEALNDEKNDCASTMFSYINIYGRYPPGIFANMCKEGKEGLDCTNVTASASASATSDSIPRASSTAALALLSTFLVLCLFFL
uniref:GPI-anchored protein LORELEI n=1 Tax=Noccaea caerulescens TaxID=107243 RepID=A0A1J3D4F8_NOCCA